MEFLIGDILVLGLMVGLLAWFRQNDRNNRSLEKIKRFSDKAMEDLGGIVELRAQELREISYEVELHEKVSMAAIERLKAVENAIDAKNQDMVALRDRMDTYNTALMELVAMTQKAEENITRLRDESAYIDKVGRRLRNASTQLDQIEHRLPRLVQEMEDKNRAMFEDLHQNLTGQISSELGDLEHRLKDTDRYAQEIMAGVRHEVHDVQEDLAAKAEAYRGAFSLIEAEYRAKLNDTRELAVAMQHDIMANLEKELKVERDAIRAKSREGEEILAKRLLEMEEFAQSARSEVMETLKRIEIFADTKFSENAMVAQEIIERKNAEHMELIKNFSVSMEARHRALVDRASGDHDALQVRLGEERKAIQAELDTFTVFLRESRDGLEQRFVDADAGQKAAMDSFMQSLRNRVDKMEQALYKAEDDLGTRLKASHEQGLVLAENLMLRINQDVETKTESMRASLEKRVEELNEWGRSSHAQIEQNFTGLRERVDAWIADSRSYMANLDDHIHKLNTESMELNKEHKETVAKHIQETRQRLDSYEQGLTNRVQNLEEYITRAEHLVTDEFRRLDGLTKELSEKNAIHIEETFRKDRDVLVEKQNEWLDHLRGSLKQDQNRLIQDMDNQREEVLTHLDGLNKRLSDDRVLAEQQLVDVQTLQGQLSTELQGWRSAMEALKTVEAKELADVEKLIKDEAQAQEERLRSNFTIVRETVEATIEAEKKKIDQGFASLSVHATGLRTSLQQEMQAGIQSLQGKAQSLYEKIQKELDGSFQGQQEKIQRLLGSVEEDIGRLQEVSAQSAIRVSEWEGSIKKADDRIKADVENLMAKNSSRMAEWDLKLREADNRNAEALDNLLRQGGARLGEWDLRFKKLEEKLKLDTEALGATAKLQAKEENDRVRVEYAALVAETVQKMKSELGHAKSDVDQDLVVVRRQLEQVKQDFQAQLTVIEEQSRALEDKAIAGLKERIDELREESRGLTRKYQDDFDTAMLEIKTSIANQHEGFRTELKLSQSLAKDIQAQFQGIRDNTEQQVASLRGLLDREKNGTDVLVQGVKDQFIRQVQTMQQDLGDQLSLTLSSLQTQIDGYKRSGEDVFLSVQSQVQKWQADYAERIKTLIQEASNMRRDSMAGIQERIDSVRDEARRLTGNVVEEVGRALAEHRQISEKQLKQTEEEAKRIEDIHKASTMRFQEIQDILGKAESYAMREFEVMREKVGQVAEQTRGSIIQDLGVQKKEFMAVIEAELAGLAGEAGKARDTLRQELAKQHDGQLAGLHTAMDSFTNQKNSFIGELKLALERGLEESKSILNDSETRLEQGRINGRDLATMLDGLQIELTKRSKELTINLENYVNSMDQSIRRTTEEREHAAFAEVEARLKDYEAGIDYRLGKLEGVNEDLEGLEKGLRMSMASLSDRIKDDLRKLADEFHEHRRSDMDLARKEMENLRLEMLGVEREIDELKKRAYDNVSEKLKVFEDEFFVDLRDRSARMQSQLEDWQSKVQGSLSRLEEIGARERESIELQYTELLKARLGELQERLFGSMNRVEGQFGAFSDGLSQRMGAVEQNVQNFNVSVAKDVESLQANAQTFAHQQLLKVQQDLDLKLAAFQRELEQRMNQSLATSKDKSMELEGMVDTIRSDLTLWQGQILQQFKSSDAQVAQDLAALRSRSLETIEGIREDFVKHRDELAMAGAEDRSRIKRDIDEIQEKMLRLSSEVDLKARETVDSFNRQFVTFSTEMQRQNKDLADEVEDRVRSFRSMVQDTRVEFDGIQKRLMGKLEDDTRILDISLKEMDKRVKAFQAHTKLFERADTLKEDLEQKINLLHQELEGIENQRRDLLNLDPYVEKVRRLSEEVNDKFIRLQSEKKRLDSMDEDFRRLGSLSQMVDTKLNQVTAASDTLTQMQLSLRQIEETHKNVELKLERLEKKSRLAEATAETVDQNFQLLQDMEARMTDLKDVFGELPARVSEAQDRVNTLFAGKKDIDTAVRSLSSIDKVLKDVESRMAELSKSREWLARTETRMSEIYRDAQEQVTLLSSLVKQEVASEPRDSSPKAAPGKSNHALVIQLAHKGWKIEEIAKTTKLSRGEIELILEMNNK